MRLIMSKKDLRALIRVQQVILRQMMERIDELESKREEGREP